MLRRVGAAVQRIRTAQDRTYMDVSAVGGLDPEWVERLEAGLVDPDVLDLARVAKGLRTSLIQLLIEAESEQ